MELDKERVVTIFKAFTDVNRLTILEMLKDGELCSCNMENKLPIKQSTLSHHMKILCDSGIVNSRRDGKWTHYSISDLGRQLAEDQMKYFTNHIEGSNICGCNLKED